jgi:predicted nucleic acid-binding protein
VNRPKYLLDSSALTKVPGREVAAGIAGRLERGELAICAIVLLSLVAAWSPERRSTLRLHLLACCPQVSTTNADLERAVEVQALVEPGTAANWPELVVAAVAERNGLVVIHSNEAFEQIATVTGQSVEWVN